MAESDGLVKMSQHIGRSCQVYWANDGEWFDGLVDDYVPSKGWHVQYYDGDDEWITRLKPELIRFDDDDGKVQKPELESTLGSTAVREEEIVVMQSPKKTDYELSDSDDEAAPQPTTTATTTVATHGLVLPSTLIDALDYDTATPDFYGDDVREGQGEDDQPRRGNEDEASDGRESALELASSLPERGVLLLGSVTSASSLPEGEGATFFRVLYVEGGSASTMFRCKTPIFTSDPTEEGCPPCFPTWKNGAFRFEMTAPAPAPPSSSSSRPRPFSALGAKSYLQPRLASVREEMEGEQAAATASAGSFSIAGEILVVIYRTRGSGGSDYLGQCSFDLQELARTGVHEGHLVGVECRSLRGSFPVTDRTGRAVGGDMAHLQANLELAWRRDAVRVGGGIDAAPPRAAAAGVYVGGKPPPSSSVGAGNGGVSVSGRSASASASAATKATGASNTQKKPKPTNQSSSSNNARRNVLAQYRIEMENKALAKRLAAQRSKKTTGHKSLAAPTDVYAIDAAPKKSIEEQAGITAAFARQIAKLPATELLDLRNSLIKEAAARDKQVKDLKATNTRLRAQAAKFTAAIDRLRKAASQPSAPSPLALTAEPKSYPVYGQGAAGLKGSEGKGADLEHKASSLNKDNSHAAAEAKSSNSNSSSSISAKSHDGKGWDLGVEEEQGHASSSSAEGKEAEAAAALDPLTAEAEACADQELTEALLEHRALQEVRRALVDRIVAVKIITAKSSAAIADAERRNELARLRIDGIEARLTGAAAGGGGGGKNKAPPSSSSSSSSSTASEELLAIDRLRGVRIELARTSAAFSAGIHVGPLIDSLTELGAIKAALEVKKGEVQADVDAARCVVVTLCLAFIPCAALS